MLPARSRHRDMLNTLTTRPRSYAVLAAGRELRSASLHERCPPITAWSFTYLLEVVRYSAPPSYGCRVILQSSLNQVDSTQKSFHSA
jgi:hypothetical protein